MMGDTVKLLTAVALVIVVESTWGLINET